MPAAIQPRKSNPNRSKTVRRKMKGEERTSHSRELTIQSQTGENEPGKPALADDPAKQEFFASAPQPEEEKTFEPVTKKIRDGITIEQNIEYHSGKGKPILQARIRLTTAVRGKRKTDGLVEAAYLLRLEVLSTSRAVKVEGLNLGIWQLNDLKLEAGSVYIAEPQWIGFPGHIDQRIGRIYLGDVMRHRMIDLPLNTEAILPAAEPFAG